MMRELLALKKRPTAVVATNDVFAVGAMMACREAGVRIPEDISITGVDNTDLGATQTPALTSIRTPIVEIGRAAAEQVIARLEGRPYERLPDVAVRAGSPRQHGEARARARLEPSTSHSILSSTDARKLD